MNSSRAVDAASCWTRADSDEDDAELRDHDPQNSRRFVAMAVTIAGDDAMRTP